MGKILFNLVIGLTLCFSKVMATTISKGLPIEIYVSLINPTKFGDRKPRMPVKIPTVYLDEYLIYFDALGGSCTLEITNENNNVVYSRPISAEETCCLLPSTLKGRYLVKFVFENLTYWGYIQL